MDLVLYCLLRSVCTMRTCTMHLNITARTRDISRTKWWNGDLHVFIAKDGQWMWHTLFTNLLRSTVCLFVQIRWVNKKISALQLHFVVALFCVWFKQRLVLYYVFSAVFSTNSSIRNFVMVHYTCIFKEGNIRIDKNILWHLILIPFIRCWAYKWFNHMTKPGEFIAWDIKRRLQWSKNISTRGMFFCFFFWVIRGYLCMFLFVSENMLFPTFE